MERDPDDFHRSDRRYRRIDAASCGPLSIARLSIVIPTLGREAVLLDTIGSLLGLEQRAAEILIIDQTKDHRAETSSKLGEWHAQNKIRWIKRNKPSIPAAMNAGMYQAANPLVLFLDDDIVPSDGLIQYHENAHAEDPGLWASVGQIIQPWQKPADVPAPGKMSGLKKDFDFPFYSNLDSNTENVMAGNLCVHRERALSIGGFDEGFIGSAFRFETEFARRVINAGGKIRFLGKASIHHLHYQSGGTRQYGSHLTSMSPMHGFGDYYYALRHARFPESWVYCIGRLFRHVRTRFHLTHPWWIPAKLIGEIRALLLASKAVKTAPQYFELPND